jgi:hypothetical protein
MSESEDSIENMPSNPKHSGFMSASGDLPTPLGGSPDQQPYGHPSEEGILNPGGDGRLLGMSDI